MKNFKRFWCPSALAIVALLLVGHAVVASGHGKGRTLIAFKTCTTDPTKSVFFAKIDVSGAVTSNGNPTGNPTGPGTGTCDNNNHNGNDDSDDDDNQGNNQSGKGHEDSHGAKVSKGHGKGKAKGNGQGNGNGNSQGNENGQGNGHGHGSNNFNLAGFDVTLTIGSASFTGTADSKGRVSTPFDAKLVANGQILMIEASGLNLVELFPIDITDGKHTVTVPISVSASKTTTDTTGTTTTTIALSSQNVTFNYCVKNGRAMGKNF